MSLRSVITMGVVASLVWCAAALAGGLQYNGPAASGGGAGVEFGTKRVGSRPTLVRRFEFHNIPAQCTGYAGTAVTGMLTLTMKVSRTRVFSGAQAINGGRLKVTVRGTFASTFRKATGTLRARGAVPGCAAADTGTVRWTAPAVGG